MRLHEREQSVRIARTKIRTAIDKLQSAHDVSDEFMLEYVGVYRHYVIKRLKGLKHVPRPYWVNSASAELFTTLLTLGVEHSLTDIEMLQALNEWEASCLKYMLRYERHGNYEDAAGIANG